jgi:hypothetical protein
MQWKISITISLWVNQNDCHVSEFVEFHTCCQRKTSGRNDKNWTYSQILLKNGFGRFFMTGLQPKKKGGVATALNH